MGRMQSMIAGIGAVFLLWFAAPLVARGIVNLGNLTGIGLSALLICYGIWQKRIHACLIGLWKNSGGKAVLLTAAFLAAAIVLTAAVETVLMVRAACAEPPAGTTAVVLGCSVKGTRPSTILWERIRAAYAYLNEYPEAFCVLSGGQGRGEDISEAECMYRCLTEMGIDGERLILEDASTNTEENLLFSQRLLRERGLGDEITIVTSEFHEYRAHLTAEKLGFKSYATPSSTFFLYFPTYYVRELYGILYYRFGK